MDVQPKHPPYESWLSQPYPDSDMWAVQTAGKFLPKGVRFIVRREVPDEIVNGPGDAQRQWGIAEGMAQVTELQAMEERYMAGASSREHWVEQITMQIDGAGMADLPLEDLKLVFMEVVEDLEARIASVDEQVADAARMAGEAGGDGDAD